MSKPLDQVLTRWAGAIGLVALAFSQQPGLVVADTKLDLVIDPGNFLSGGLHAWDAQAGFGQLQNQAYGYFFPMGSFFWAGHSLGVPAWVVQRAWWAVLLVVAYTGFLALADRLGVGRSWGRVLGAMAYALGPRLVTVLGPISAEALPLALLPWILVPLVTGARGGSPRRAAALSGLAIACIGGINAAATFAVLVLPAVWLITRRRGPRRRRLVGWWLTSAGLAVAWWFLPLLVLGRYAFPFLDTIESSRTTTSVTSLSNVLRGADHWVGFLVKDGLPVWHAGWVIAAVPLAVAATAALAVLGLWGLRMAPERTFLVGGLLAGCMCVALGYTGAAGSLFGPWVQSLLDGPLAAFRNVHKFDPVLRLPLTLGLTAALAALPAAAHRVAVVVPGEEGRWLRARPRIAPAAAAALVVALLVGASAPAWAGRLPNDGAFEAVPPWWQEAATWLSTQDGRTLLEPASGFGQYDWGQPWDEPLQALAQAPWAVRGAAPLGSPGLTRYLDAVEQEITTGRPSADLGAALRRAGVGQVLLRNDLAPSASATPSAVARAVLAHSPGLRLVRGFGPEIAAGTDGAEVRTLEVFAIEGATGDPRVSLVPDDEVAFTGGPEAVVRLAADPRVWVDLATPSRSREAVVTDTLPRRQVNVGAPVTQNSSEVLDAGTASLGGRPLRDIDPYGSAEVAETVVSLADGATASVTSSATDPNLPKYRGPVGGPYAALDGSTGTSWVAAMGDPVPTWSLALPRPTTLGRVAVVFAGLPGGVARPARIVVTADGTSQDLPVVGDRVAATLDTPATRLSIQLMAAQGDDRPLGVAEVQLPIALHPALTLPDAPPGTSPAWSFATQPLSRPACVRAARAWTCDASLARPGAEGAALNRAFGSSAPVTLSVGADVTPIPGPALDRWLDAALGHQVVGSSQRFVDPAARPGAAFDGNPDTVWVPVASDAAPTLTLSLPGPVTVSGVRVTTSLGSAHQLDRVVLRSDDGSMRTVQVSPGTAATFEPMTGSVFRISMRLLGDLEQSGLDSLGLSEVDLVGAPGVPDALVTLPCGQAPDLVVDGRVVQMSLSARVTDVVAGGALRLTPCQPSVALSAGPHELRAVPNDLMAVTAVRLGRSLSSAAGGAASPTVDRWEDESRRVEVAASAQPRLLVLTEGANDGWQATSGGVRLEPLRVDGWRQAWRVPAGLSGPVDLVYRPGGLHRLGLLVGAALLLVLAGLAAWPGDRRDVLPPSPPGGVPPIVWDLVTVGVAIALTGGWGLLAWILARAMVARSRAWLAAAVAWVVLAAAMRAAWWPNTQGQGVAVGIQVLVLAVTLSAALAAVRAAPSADDAPTSAPVAPPETRTPGLREPTPTA